MSFLEDFNGYEDSYSDTNDAVSALDIDLGSKIDWSNASSLNAPKVDVVPAGKYVLTVKDAWKKTDRNGNHFLRILFKIIEGAYSGQTIMQAFFIYGQQREMDRYVTLWEACGYQKEEISTLRTIVGTPVLAVVKIRDKNDGTGQCNFAETFFPYVPKSQPVQPVLPVQPKQPVQPSLSSTVALKKLEAEILRAKACPTSSPF